MNESRHLPVVIVLGLVILGAGIWIARWAGLWGPHITIPDRLLDAKVDLMDADTSEPVQLTKREMQDLPQKGGFWKNPKTGKFTLGTPLKCFACGVTFAAPSMPKEIAPANVTYLAPQEQARLDRAQAAWRAAQKCPKCGKCPFPPPEAAPPMEPTPTGD